MAEDEERDGESMVERMKKGMDAYDGGKCFIATEIYGADSREVAVLKRVRDRVLFPSMLGRRFVDLYYRISPAIIPRMRRSTFVRIPLRALVASCVFLADR